MAGAPRVGNPGPAGEVGAFGLAFLVTVAIGLSALALYGVWALWPSEPPLGGEASGHETVHVLGHAPTVSRSVLLVALAGCAGVLGGLPRVLRSLALGAGNRELRRRAMRRHALSLLAGAVVAALLAVVLVVLVSRPGPYRLAAAACLVGFLEAPAERAVRRRFG